MPIIDTHIHFWDPGKFRYPWLEGEDFAAIRTRYTPAQLLTELKGTQVQGLVHVQADIDRAIDPVEETRWLASLLAQMPAGFPELVAIGYADLRSAELHDVLRRHAEHPFVRGIRQEAWFDPESTLPGVLRTNLLSDPLWLQGLQRVMRQGLLFELLVKPEQLAQAATIFEQLPELPVVLEHTGVPVLENGELPRQWRGGMRDFAAKVPHGVLKISGMGFINPAWRVEEIAPIVKECIEIFGPDRCMFGSNFPVERPSSSYDHLWQAYEAATTFLSASDRTCVFSGTARRTYRLGSA